MKPKKPPMRFWIACMIFMTTFMTYTFRSNMSVSIVGMVERNGTKKLSMCEIIQNKTQKFEFKKHQSPSDVPKYNWDEMEQSQVLASYFYGYVLGCLPAGALAEYFGPWIVIVWTTVISIVLNGLTPLAATGGYEVVCVVRGIMGFLSGLVYPAVNVLIARWSPPNEKGKFLTAMMGNTLGTVVTFQAVGAITQWINWYWGFYAVSIFATIYTIVFAIITSDSPETHKWISQEEREYIIKSQKGTVSSEKKIPPYKDIIKSVPFWALCVAQWGNLWGLYLILSYAPKYMAQVLGFDIKSSGFLASLPNLFRLIFSGVYGVIGDYIRKNEIMSLTKTRKVFIITSHFLPSLCLTLILACGCVYQGPIALLILSQVFNASVVIGHLQNPQDLSPNYAGTIYGLMSFVAGMTGFIVPLVQGALLKGMKDTHKYHLWGPWIIFLIGAAVMSFCGIVFILIGSGETQPWNRNKKKEQEEEQDENLLHVNNT